MSTPGRRLLDVARATLFMPRGFGGSTAASRYVGGTTNGSPASGTFRAGDFVTSLDGAIYVCTAGGTPGTWEGSLTTGDNASVRLGGSTLTVSGGRLYVDGRAVAFQDELSHDHGGTTGAASTGTAHTHPISGV